MQIPDKIGGAKVIQYVIINQTHKFTEQTKQYSGNILLGPMYGLAICVYNKEKVFIYLVAMKNGSQ